MYEAHISSFKEISNDKGGYIEIKFTLPDREYTYCVFPTQIDYVTSTLRNQIEQPELDNLGDVLKYITKNNCTINVWFSYNQDYGRMNVALHQPATEEEAIDETVL